MRVRALVESRVDADRMLLAARSALAADADLLTLAERAEVDALMAGLRAMLGSDDPVQIEAATKALAQGTEAFAALRMNRGIQRALAGKNIAAV